MKLLFGADPELFVFNPNSQQFVSGHNMVSGTKANPFPVNDGAIQVDGLALEFNITPCEDEEQWVKRINSVKGQLASRVPGYLLRAVPVADFTPDTLAAQPPEALELGCEPDYNAWMDGAANPRPDGDQFFRTGSGHVHIGWTSDADVRSKNHLADCMDVVRQLDYYLGVNSLLWDPDNRRRSMYGKAGAFRPKPYGVEYRVLSNSWLTSDELTRWVFRAAKQAMTDMVNGNRMERKYGDLAREIIDNNVTDWRTKYPNLTIPMEFAA